MRNIYLVSYDITGPDRLRTVFRTMKGFGEHLQYSVFVCNLSPKEKVIMVEALSGVMDHREDKVIVVNLGPAEGLAEDRIEFIGRHGLLPERDAVIV